MLKILYISKDNRCRSILAEAITRHVSNGLVAAESAGINPDRVIHPAVFGYLRERDIETLQLHTKGIKDIDADKVDVVVALTEKISDEQLENDFAQASALRLPLDDISHSELSDSALKAFFDKLTSTVEFRVRKALAASTSVAGEEEGRHLIDHDAFIAAFCKLEDDKI